MASIDITAPLVPRSAPSELLRRTPIIAVLRARDAADYAPVIDVLLEHGVRSVELTLSTPGTFEHLSALVAGDAGEKEIGVGTITTVEEAQRAIDAGAHYLVTPVLDAAIIAVAVRAGVPIYPGGFTPTELFAGWRAGATAVKIFPAQTVGPQFGTHLRGPFPDLEFVPSGGISLDDVPAWLEAGALAVSLGGPLVGDALKGGSLDALAERVRRIVALVG